MTSLVRSVMTGEENAAISYIPERLGTEVRKYAALYGGMINEIRLRSGGMLSVTIMGENVTSKMIVTEEECEDSFMRLCRNSLYSCNILSSSAAILSASRPQRVQSWEISP